MNDTDVFFLGTQRGVKVYRGKEDRCESAKGGPGANLYYREEPFIAHRNYSDSKEARFRPRDLFGLVGRRQAGSYLYLGR